VTSGKNDNKVRKEIKIIFKNLLTIPRLAYKKKLDLKEKK
jgi:hypothetical protein